MNTKIAKTAIIEDGAQIEDGVEIGEFCRISSKATIKGGTKIADHAQILGATTIGKNNKIGSFSVLGGDPQSIKYRGEETELIIGDENTIAEFCLFSRGTPEFGAKTIVGNGNFFMAYTHVAHDCRVGDRNIFANCATLAGHVEIGSFVNVGGLTPVHQFVKIGSYCMIGGASAVSQDIPPFCLAEGNRAKIRGLNRAGLRKHFTHEQIDAIYAAFKDILSGRAPYKEVASEWLAKEIDERVRGFCEFILSSKRGIPFERKNIEQEL